MELGRKGWALAACLLQACLVAAAAGSAPSTPDSEETCKPCYFTQGAASFGVLYGGEERPLKLRPLDLLHVESATALPLANPVLTALELTERLTSGGGSSGGTSMGRAAAVDAISHPTLATTPDGRLLMFFAAHACGRDRWGIAAAESPDGSGTTWRGLGMVLEDEGADMHAPSLFHHDGSWFLVPEVAGQREVCVFKATSFPFGWEPAGVLVEQPLAGVSVVQHGELWWLLGHKPGAGQGGQDRVLAAFRAQSPLGPWTEHPNRSLAAEASTAAGSVFAWNGAIHRLGRSCRGTACGEVQAMQVLLSGDSIEQSPVQLELGRSLWRQRAGWDSAGWTHLAIGQRPDGAWLAVVEASQLPPATPALSQQLQAAIGVFRTLALLCIALLVLSGAARVPAVRSLLLKQQWGQLLLRWTADPGSHKLAKAEDSQLPAWAPPSARGALDGANVAKQMPSSARQRGSTGNLLRSLSSCGGGGSRGQPSARSSGALRLRLPPWRLVLAMVTLVLALLAAGATRRVQQIAQPFFVQPQAIAVEGQWSRFTLMVMSYSARLHELQWYVSHYSQCPSVGEILVVWNKGPPPEAAAFLSDVPVRVRLEATNSMNNRFRPDPDIKYRSVLSLDDDILIPCTTIESTFARWRTAPQQLAGYYPRLLVPPEGGSGAPVYQFEEFVFQQGAYNTILAGAAFMDSATFFPLYFSSSTAPARALVDEVFNCDDLLLNFVVANWTAGQAKATGAGPAAAGGTGEGGASAMMPPVQLVRPERRIDISRLSGVGISHNPARFKAAADRCLAEFSQLFGGCPLVLRQVDPHYGRPPNCHLWPLDCVYLQ
ncbi:hypothetical protein CHLNCDRAFT_54762 [Chlorella variabilis]|uniref:Uncharacterized protein n=1 Tax=Chlorella variabilis TaxID=554065 RepID=E1ZQC7_CHLVA|nr:hypothetical protein CHLNCDRAFT_54762 [Chlorella variabilis]EFN51907.1 hypothetical protein CHLNCDRAFT_54762 [Chlorella variabilis]|eukprot:XP_005844009.1 hypothetical protein CHLNCDRAFT_54762 [Chlorella variabilis]